MGMICTDKQGDALEVIASLHGKDGLIAGKYFVEGPRPRDYSDKTMYLGVFEIIGKNVCVRVGYVRIRPDGKIYFPKVLREVLGK